MHSNNICHYFPSGKVIYVDSMGSETAVVQAARVSYGDGTKTITDDINLIRYLLRHAHMTPFEMIVLKVHVECPMYIARQIMRHRTFSFNEISGRYSVLQQKAYKPKHFYKQSITNKQGTSQEENSLVHNVYQDAIEDSFECYEELIEAEVARELARGVLPLATLTRFYMCGNLRNWMHFIQLRLPKNAQSEINDVAFAVKKIIQEKWPNIYKAYEDYVLHSVKFSKQEMELLLQHLQDSIHNEIENCNLSAREKTELKNKISKR